MHWSPPISLSGKGLSIKFFHELSWVVAQHNSHKACTCIGIWFKMYIYSQVYMSDGTPWTIYQEWYLIGEEWGQLTALSNMNNSILSISVFQWSDQNSFFAGNWEIRKLHKNLRYLQSPPIWFILRSTKQSLTIQQRCLWFLTKMFFANVCQ